MTSNANYQFENTESYVPGLQTEDCKVKLCGVADTFLPTFLNVLPQVDSRTDDRASRLHRAGEIHKL